MTTTNKAIEALKNAFAAAATNERDVKEQAQARIEVAQNDEERAEHEKQFMRARTHERYNEALSSMSDKALALLTKYKVDANALASQSRELKKRSIAILEAIAHSQRVKDNALDALLQRIAAKREASLTIAQIQREMQHKTDTQAGYFKTCAVFYNAANYNKDEKKVTFNYDSAVLKALLDIYK